MSEDNIVKSSDVNKTPEKKTTKKTTATKKEAVKKEDKPQSSDGKVLILFESGASYSSGDVRFTRENPIQEVTNDQAEFLLTLDNFRMPDPLEVEDYLKSKED